jgi:hypothetical protein
VFAPVQLNAKLVDTPIAPFKGDEMEGVPAVAQAVVKLHTGPAAEPPQLFLAMIFQ